MFACVGGRFRAAIGVAVALVLMSTLMVGTTVSAATPTACRVKNLDTGVVMGSFRAAVKAAKDGHHLRVKGTCVGITTIGKDLKVVGLRTKRSGEPTLAGGAAGARQGPVVLLRRDTTVSIKGLTIRGGRPCCGITSRGDLTLRDVVVRRNSFMAGGGLNIEAGKVILAGATVVRANEGAWGGGVHIAAGATLVMNDTSSVRGNTANATGGGVLAWGGATLVMNDGSSIVANTSKGEDGGGVSYDVAATLVGVDCGVNVRGNTPLDCYQRPAP